MKINFNVTGQERKSLVGAISAALNAPTKYLGMPTAAYEVGGYNIDKTGTLIGADDEELVARLAEQGFGGEVQYDNLPLHDETEIDGLPPKKRRGILDILVEELNANEEENGDGGHWERLHSTPQMECGDGKWRNLDGTYAAKTDDGEPDTLVVEMPLTGFTPEKLDNLAKLVNAKAPLLKAALGAEGLPIQQTADTLKFPWFSGELDGETVKAYTTLISLLCKTAKEKKRVTAKEKAVDGSQKYAMRCFLLSLGFIGDEYKAARKILLAKLEGNSSWKSDESAEASQRRRFPNNGAEVAGDDISE